MVDPSLGGPMRSLLALVLLAGCASPALDDGPTTPPPSPATLPLVGCTQYHNAFTVLAADFQPFLPEGFQVVDEGAGTTTLLVELTACSAGRHLALLTVPAIAPADLRRDGYVDEVLVEAYADPHMVAAAAGYPLAPCTCQFQAMDQGPFALDNFVVDAQDVRYEMTATLATGSGPFEARLRQIFAKAGGGIALLSVDAEAATDRGLGEAVLLAEGSAALQVTPTVASHAIRDFSIALNFAEA